MSIRYKKYLTVTFIIISSFFLARLLDVIYDQLNAPFDLVFETPNLSTIKLIKEGKNPYDPNIYATPPFIISIYTPLYHYIAATLPVADSNPFLFGRVVSMIAMFSAAFVLFVVGNSKRLFFLSVLAFSLFFSIWPVISNTAFLKNDPLALLFSVYAIALVHRNKSPRSIIFVAFLCVLAVLSKQSYVSAFITCFFYLFISNRNLFYIYLCSTLIFSTVVMIIVSSLWGDGFWFSTIYALRNQMTFQQSVNLWKQMLKQPIFCFIMGLSFVTLYPYLKEDAKKIVQESPYLLYTVVSFFILCLTAGKIGSSTNYFFEFIISQLMWIIFIIKNKPHILNSKLIVISSTIILLICSILEVTLSKREYYSFVNNNIISQKKIRYNNMRNAVKSLGIKTPIILDLVRHNHVFSLSDEICLNDPYLYRLLWRNGIMDYHPFIESIKDHYYDIIMLPKNVSVINQSKDPFNKAVITIFKYYKIGTSGMGYNYFIRKSKI